MTWIISLFLLFTATSLAAEPAKKTSPLLGKALSPWTRKVLDPLLQQGKITPQEHQILLDHPELGPVLQPFSCKAWTLSLALCARKDQDPADMILKARDEETDAVRHFVLSSLIGEVAGRNLATRLMTAHEGDPSKWNEAAKMDLHNNAQGIEWANHPMRKLMGLGENRLVRAALKHLMEGKLKTLNKGQSLCADPAQIKIPIEADLAEREQQIQEKIKTIKPVSWYCK